MDRNGEALDDDFSDGKGTKTHLTSTSKTHDENARAGDYE